MESLRGTENGNFVSEERVSYEKVMHIWSAKILRRRK
jgi:hypothetical protein